MALTDDRPFKPALARDSRKALSVAAYIDSIQPFSLVPPRNKFDDTESLAPPRSQGTDYPSTQAADHTERTLSAVLRRDRPISSTRQPPPGPPQRESTQDIREQPSPAHTTRRETQSAANDQPGQPSITSFSLFSVSDVVSSGNANFTGQTAQRMTRDASTREQRFARGLARLSSNFNHNRNTARPTGTPSASSIHSSSSSVVSSIPQHLARDGGQHRWNFFGQRRRQEVSTPSVYSSHGSFTSVSSHGRESALRPRRSPREHRKSARSGRKKSKQPQERLFGKLVRRVKLVLSGEGSM